LGKDRIELGQGPGASSSSGTIDVSREAALLFCPEQRIVPYKRQNLEYPLAILKFAARL
jgi:hypothetical protein